MQQVNSHSVLTFVINCCGLCYDTECVSVSLCVTFVSYCKNGSVCVLPLCYCKTVSSVCPVLVQVNCRSHFSLLNHVGMRRCGFVRCQKGEIFEQFSEPITMLKPV